MQDKDLLKHQPGRIDKAPGKLVMAKIAKQGRLKRRDANETAVQKHTIPFHHPRLLYQTVLSSEAVLFLYGTCASPCKAEKHL